MSQISTVEASAVAAAEALNSQRRRRLLTLLGGVVAVAAGTASAQLPTVSFSDRTQASGLSNLHNGGPSFHELDLFGSAVVVGDFNRDGRMVEAVRAIGKGEFGSTWIEEAEPFVISI